MTEAKWLACDEPQTILEFVRIQATPRKCRLLAASFCRHVLPLVKEPCAQRAVDVAEEYADGLVGVTELLAVSKQVFDVYANSPVPVNPVPANTEIPLAVKAESIAHQSTFFLTGDFDNYLEQCCICTDLATLRWALLRAGPDEAIPAWSSRIQWQRLLIKDVVGNPFRPVVADPSWLTSRVVSLAQRMYESRDFATMPMLGDALKDTGCDNDEVLDHCRNEGLHVKGCWLIDILTGRK